MGFVVPSAQKRIISIAPAMKYVISIMKEVSAFQDVDANLGLIAKFVVTFAVTQFYCARTIYTVTLQTPVSLISIARSMRNVEHLSVFRQEDVKDIQTAEVDIVCKNMDSVNELKSALKQKIVNQTKIGK